MKRKTWPGCGVALTIAVAAAAVRADTAASLYMSHDQIAAALAASIAKGTHPAVAPVAATDGYLINKVHREHEAPPLTHPGWTEVHLILDGKAVFVTGGQIRNVDGKATSIEGGLRRTVVKGDVIVVPPDTPHWYTQFEAPIEAIEVRFKSDKVQ